MTDSDFSDYTYNKSSSSNSDSNGGQSNSFVRVRNMAKHRFSSFEVIVASHSFSNARSRNALSFLNSTIFKRVGKIKSITKVF